MAGDLYIFYILSFISLNPFVEIVAISAVKGSTVQLECPHRHSGPGTLDWSFRSSTSSRFTIYSTGQNVVPFLSPELKNRLSVTGNHTIGEYHLNISDIRKTDQGTYECLVTGFYNVQELTVIVEPSSVRIDNVNVDSKLLGTEGQHLVIRCTAIGGQPAPDVNIVIAGSVITTGKQSVQHTLSTVTRSYDGQTVTCQAGYKEIAYYPLTNSVLIYLNLKPLPVHLSSNTVSTEETKPLIAICSTSGSRPGASIYWLLGNDRTNITYNSTEQYYHDLVTDTFTVTSILTYTFHRKYNGQSLICGATNVVTAINGKVESNKTLDIKYAPEVIVGDRTFSQHQSSRQISSIIDGNPVVNTCSKWNHVSKYGELIRQFNGSQVLKLPSLSEDKRYQDTGEYICTAENGIVGKNGLLNQNGSGFITSNAPPIIMADNDAKQYGESGKNTEISINVYSVPKYSSIRWYRGSINLTSDKYFSNEDIVIVKDVFHGVEIQLDGYRATLVISNLTSADFTNYTVQLYYEEKYVQNTVSLEEASAPESPTNFSIVSQGETSITIEWIPGYNGGLIQIFYIEYRLTGNEAWGSKNIPNNNVQSGKQEYTLRGLQDGMAYELRMLAGNYLNKSLPTNVQTATTLKKVTRASLGAVIGGVTTAISLVIIGVVIIIVIFIHKKRRDKRKTNTSVMVYENSAVTFADNINKTDKKEDAVRQISQISESYELLGVKGKADIYDDLKDLSKGSIQNYESLGEKDKPNVYDGIDNHKAADRGQIVHSAESYALLGVKDKPNLYDDLEVQVKITNPLVKRTDLTYMMSSIHRTFK